MAKTQHYLKTGLVEITKSQDSFGFHLERWLKKSLKGLGISYYDECCPDQTIQTLEDDGVVSLKVPVTYLNSDNNGPFGVTLADGTNLQEKIIKMTLDDGDVVVTVAHLNGGTTLTFGDAGDFVKLQYIHNKWYIIANAGVVVA